MRILICAFTYYPAVDGVQNVTEYQAEGLAALGHEVTVLTGWPEGKSVPETETYKGVKIIRFHAYTDNMIHHGDKKAYQNLLMEYSKKVDVIMTVCPESWCTDWAIPLAGKLDCAMVMMTHGIHNLRWKGFRDKSAYGLLRKVYGDLRWPQFFWRNWKNIKKYDAIIQLHEKDFATQYFAKHGVQGQHVLYNAVDDAFFESDVPKEKQIVNVGTYCKNKNQMKALEAFYAADLPGYKLVLIGSQPNGYYQQLKARAAELDAEHGHKEVEILAGIPRAQTIQRVKQSEIYLLTSISEMFPVSLIEGMAAGCAWVSTDVGIDRYLPGGLIADTPADIAAALEQLSVPEKNADFAAASREFASRNCRRKEQVASLEKILLDAVQQHRAKSEGTK